jgi:D-serine deaminase-like pyridoxal phosphate-dependent protein
MHVPALVVGGSPTFSIHCKRDNVDCSPGTFVYWDKGYMDLCPEQEFLPAAVLVTRVISLPSPGRLCTDLGHKSVAAENELQKRVFFLDVDGLNPVGQSEEHLVLENTGGREFQTGDLLYGLPYHICPTVALYDRVYTVENSRVTGEWKNIARDRKLSV